MNEKLHQGDQPGGKVTFIVPQLIPVQKSPVWDESDSHRSSQKSGVGGGGCGFPVGLCLGAEDKDKPGLRWAWLCRCPD